jgi:cytochrome c556
MKKSILALAAGTFIAGAVLTSCKSPEEKVENAKDNVIEASEDLNKAKEEYLIEIENYKLETAQELEANDVTIADFEAKIKRDNAVIKSDYKKKVAELKQKNQELKDKMDNYKAEGKDKWDSFKAEFNHDMEELGKAFKDIATNNVE